MDDQTVITDQNEQSSTVALSDQTVVTKPQLPEVPGYTVEKLLGVGGMAEVFLARDDQLGRLAAIKMINSAGSMDSDFRQRFEDEARTVAGFSHPNIITVYGFGEIEGKQYIAMSFESGGELDDQLKQGSVAELEALQITAKLAAALAYSHQRDIVHRDIKPANVLFDEAGSPILSDFGIAKGLNAGSALTQTGVAIGSPAYMSPEQLMGQKVDGKTDVYSLGLVLYQMLVGRLPPNELKMSQDPTAIRQTIEDGLKGNRALKATSEITDVLFSCLQFDPSNRLSAGDLAARLQDIGSTADSGISKWAGIGLAGALVLAVLGMASILFKPAATGTVNFSLSPENTTLIVDGLTTTSLTMELDSGNHSYLALASGYQGTRETFLVSTNNDNNVLVQLEKLVLPSNIPVQMTQFHKQLGSEVDAANIDYTDINFPAFIDILQLKATSGADEEQWAEAESAFLARYQGLANQGDILAQVTIMLAVDEGLIDINAADTQRYKSALGKSDYPLAAYLSGLLLRGEVNEALQTGSVDVAKVSRYKAKLEQAQSNGFTQQGVGALINEAATVLQAATNR